MCLYLPRHDHDLESDEAMNPETIEQTGDGEVVMVI